MNLTVGRKITGGFLFVIIIMAVMSDYTYVKIININQDYQTMMDANMDKIILAEELATDIAEEAGAKDEKAHAAAVHKTKLRQLYWAEIEALREAARVASLRYPRAVMVAMDSLDTPRVVRGFYLSIFSLADSVFYGAYLEGNPVEPVSNAVDLDDRNVVTPLDEVEEGAA